MVLCVQISVRAQETQITATSTALDEGMRQEVIKAVDAGLAWLSKQQSTNGAWSGHSTPGVTAFVMLSFQGWNVKGGPAWDAGSERKAYAYLLSRFDQQGGIAGVALGGFQTALCLSALRNANQDPLEPFLSRGRHFLLTLQKEFEKKQRTIPEQARIPEFVDDEDTKLARSVRAGLEAFKPSSPEQSGAAGGGGLDWENALGFLKQWENPASRKQAVWATGDPIDDFHHAYVEGAKIPSGLTNSESGRVAFFEYPGLGLEKILGLPGARIIRGDPRVVPVVEWMKQNYTLDENPGLGEQGIYHFFFAASRSLRTQRVDSLELLDGRLINWRVEIARKLLGRQARSGFWRNASIQFGESDPVIATALAVSCLREILADPSL